MWLFVIKNWPPKIVKTSNAFYNCKYWTIRLKLYLAVCLSQNSENNVPTMTWCYTTVTWKDVNLYGDVMSELPTLWPLSFFPLLPFVWPLPFLQPVTVMVSAKGKSPSKVTQTVMGTITVKKTINYYRWNFIKWYSNQTKQVFL